MCVSVREQRILTSMSKQGTSISFPSLPKRTSSRLGKHNITSKQLGEKKKTGLEVPGIPRKCSVTHIHTHKWWSSVFFYNRQLLLAHDPWDNWFCLQALNHFLPPIFLHNCSLMSHYHTVTPTRCKHMKRLMRWEVLSHQLFTFGHNYWMNLSAHSLWVKSSTELLPVWLLLT